MILQIKMEMSYMLGHIVHNENVVKDLDDAGAKGG